MGVSVRSADRAELPLIQKVFLASAREGLRGTFEEEHLEEFAQKGLPVAALHTKKTISNRGWASYTACSFTQIGGVWGSEATY